jgi:hypothetical protein
MEGPLDDVRCDNLRMHRLTNQPSYFIISDRTARTGPVTETSGAHRDGGPHRSSDLRMKARTSTRPKVRAARQTEAHRKGHASSCNRSSMK